MLTGCSTLVTARGRRSGPPHPRRTASPRQILLARMLGLPVLRYAHVPLVLGPDGRRLAKRHGAVTLSEGAALGEGPEQARAWMARSLCLARVGETPSPGDLIAHFDPQCLPRDPTVWSP